jgi:hypothetical protein
MRIKYFVLGSIMLIFLLVILSLAVTEPALSPISVDRDNYQIDDTVNLSININPENYSSYYLAISALNNSYTYKGDFNPVMFFYPTEEGIYTIALVEKSTGAIFYSLSFNVNAKNETNATVKVIYENILSPKNASAEPVQGGSLISQSPEQNETKPEISTVSLSSSLISTDKKEYLVGGMVSVSLDINNSGQISLYHSYNGVSERYMGDLDFIRFIPEGIGTHTLILKDANNNIIFEYDFKVSSGSGLAERSIGILNSAGSAEAAGMNVLDEKGGTGSFDIPLNKKSLKKIRLNNLQFSKGNSSLNLSIGVDDVLPEMLNTLRIKQKRVVKAFAIDSGSLNFTNGTATGVAVGNELWKCRQWDFLAQQCLDVWEKVMDLIPGTEYDIELSPGDPGYAETGVASINTKKPIYYPGETARIIMVVLDTEGHLVSNADVSLTITAPDKTVITLTTSNGEITETDRGIYETTYTNTIWGGTYSLEVIAIGSNVNSTMFSFFSVKPYYEFDILRETPVTTDPWKGDLTSNLRIISYTNITTFNFTEVLPGNFEITNSGGASVSIANNKTYLSWTGLSNDSFVSYSARPPMVTPELYEIGPSFVSYDAGIFYEARPWYLAVDPELQFLYDDCNGATVNSILWVINTTSGDAADVYAGGGYYYLNSSDAADLTIATNSSKTDFTKFTIDASLQKVAGNGRAWHFGIGTGQLWDQTFCQTNTGWSPRNGYAVCISHTAGLTRLVRIDNAVSTNLTNTTWRPNNVSFYNFTFVLNSSGVFFFVNNTRILNSSDTTYSQGYITISTGGGGANQGMILVNNVWYYEQTTPPTVNINTSLDGLFTTNTRPSVDFNFTSKYSATANCSLYFNNISYNFTPNVNNNSQTIMTVNTSLSDANYSVFINCTSTYGDIGKSSVIHIVIDTTGPNSSLYQPANNTVIDVRSNGYTYKLNATVNDSLSTIDTVTFMYRMNSSDTWKIVCQDTDHAFPFNCTWNLTTLNNSFSYQVMVYANDSLGNIGFNDTHVNITILTYFINISSMLFDDDVTLPLSEIDLQAGTTKSVYCNITVVDPINYSLIQGVNATIYSILNQSNSTDNNRSHYSDSSCTFITGGGNSADYQCVFDVWHFAINGTWNCTARAWNSYSNITLNDNTTINQLFALNVSIGVIDYSNLQPNQTSQNITVNISNVGNMPMNISVYGFGGNDEVIGAGLSMICQINNITVSFERFSTNTTANYSTKRQLSGSLQDLALTIPAKTNVSQVRVNSTYWQFMVPPQAQSFGQCNGSVVFVAQAP